MATWLKDRNLIITAAQIATEMALSLRTVHSHRYRLYKKMGVGTRAQVIALINKNQSVSSETSDIGLPALVS